MYVIVVCVTHKQNFQKNQNSNLNEFMEIAQKKFPSLVIAAFNSAEVWSNNNALMDRYSSHFKPLKETKTFHHTEIVNNKIHGNLLSPGFTSLPFFF